MSTTLTGHAISRDCMPMCRLNPDAFPISERNYSTTRRSTDSAETVSSWHATLAHLQKMLLTKLQTCFHVLKAATACRVVLPRAINDTMSQQQRLNIWPAVPWTQQSSVQCTCTCQIQLRSQRAVLPLMPQIGESCEAGCVDSPLLPCKGQLLYRAWTSRLGPGPGPLQQC